MAIGQTKHPTAQLVTGGSFFDRNPGVTRRQLSFLSLDCLTRFPLPASDGVELGFDGTLIHRCRGGRGKCASVLFLDLDGNFVRFARGRTLQAGGGYCEWVIYYFVNHATNLAALIMQSLILTGIINQTQSILCY